MLPVRSALIAIDAMSGDRPVADRLAGVTLALRHSSRLRVELVGRRKELSAWLETLDPETRKRVSIIHADDVIGMDEPVAQVIRGRPDSSLRRVLERVAGEHVDGCVSCGNTAALVGLSRLLLKSLPGIDRPALCASLPADNGHTWVLDLGANVTSSADQLVQFAAMGAALASAVDENPSPRVGLVNIGSENSKGGDSVRQAGSILAGSGLNYIGFVEGDDFYSGRCDVAVCDGFVGNVSLKASEGISRLMLNKLRSRLKGSAGKKLAGWVVGPVLRRLLADLDPRNYNGACLIGLDGIVVKSHGNSDAHAFAMALHYAELEAERDINALIRQRLAQSGHGTY